MVTCQRIRDLGNPWEPLDRTHEMDRHRIKRDGNYTEYDWTYTYIYIYIFIVQYFIQYIYIYSMIRG